MAKTPVTVTDDDADTEIKTGKTKSTTNSELSSAILEAEVEKALLSNDPLELAKVQIKLLMSIANNLNKIDWKLWEFYNRLGK